MQNNKLFYKTLEAVLEEVALENGINEEDVVDFIETVITRLEYQLESYEDPMKSDDSSELDFS